MSPIGIEVILDLIIGGVLLGILYGLASAGLSLIFGVLKIFNVAHGMILVLSAYINYFIIKQLGLSLTLSAMLTVLIIFCLGLLLNRFIVYPFRKQEEKILIITLCVGLIIEQIIYLIWGPTYLMGAQVNTWSINLFGTILPAYKPFILAITVVTFFMLWMFLKMTKLGIAIRATAQDEEAAMLFGASTTKIWNLSFALSCALAAVAGVLLNLVLMFTPTSGWDYTLIALAATTLGGLGNITRTMASGLILGIVESFIAYFISPSWRSIVFFVTILIALIVKSWRVYK
jgi:branched-chain amino acid transport system permease protein